MSYTKPKYYKVHTDGHEVALEPIYEELMPVVHGYDTGRCRIFHCSVCGYGVNDIFQEDEQNYPVGEFNYCPNCGAKMK